MADERAEQLSREYAIAQAAQTPKEIGGIPPVVAAAATKQEEQTTTFTPAQTKEGAQNNDDDSGIMVPKWRFDEVNSAYQTLKQNSASPKQDAAPAAVITNNPSPDVDKLIDAKLAPFKIQLEVDQVMKANEDFSDYAKGALDRIKRNQSLSLEEAYKLEKFDILQTKAREQGKQDALEIIGKKSSLAVEQSGRKTPAKPVEELIADKSIPLSELAKMLPHD